MKTFATLRIAFYARVSSDHLAEEGTIASQVAVLRQRIAADDGQVEPDLEFLDDGYSGGTLLRPALEQLRDQAAQGALDRLYVQAPDRLARNYAYQFLLLDEFRRAGVEVVFLNHALGRSAEDDVLLQVQGVIAEYERAKISERSRRGKLHAARTGQVSVLAGAPYGYRFVGKQAGSGQAWLRVVELVGSKGLVIGGKSMGDRIASLIADEAEVAGLVCLGYPFHPVGKPDRLRVQHLAAIKTPTLIVQGERDPFGSREDVGRYKLSRAVRVKWMPDGDHSFKPRKSSGRTEQENWEAAVEEIVAFLPGGP